MNKRNFIKYTDLEKSLEYDHKVDGDSFVGLDQLLTAWAFRAFLKKLGIKSA